MKRQNLRFYACIGLCFVLAGLLLSSQHLIRHWQHGNTDTAFAASAKQQQVQVKPATVSGTPAHIDVPAAGISVDIAPGYYNKNAQTWTLSTDKAHYATITPKANDGGGNTFIYGHNRPAVFSRLLNVKPGDKAVVRTANGRTFTYEMASRYDTKPTDDSLFRYEGPPILTLQTCSGLWYQNRSLFVFNLVKVS